MTPLATAIAANGASVNFVAEEQVSDDRRALGWEAGELKGVHSHLVKGAMDVRQLVAHAPPDSIHICQGLRSNGLVLDAQDALAARGLRQWIVMETVKDSGPAGFLKRLAYRTLLARRMPALQGVFAIGARTANWLVDRGCKQERVFPFTYFLKEPGLSAAARRTGDPQRVLFVGNFVHGKGLDLLITALSRRQFEQVELAAIGSGPLEAELRAAAEARLPGRVRWIGRLGMQDVASEMADADCVVLPSRHDGWGAVMSEAMMAGTPAICSDACGALEAVRASGQGAVFPNGDAHALADAVAVVLSKRLSEQERTTLGRWASSLGAEAGARYLEAVLDHVDGFGPRPQAPWLQGIQ
jgi:glycosyltransferase involved in cell wall biosynthesis